MHIVHVISSINPSDGGPTAAIVGMCRSQVSAGIKVSIVTGFRAGENDNAADELRKCGVSVQFVGPTKGPFRSHPAMLQVLRQAAEGAEAVHIHALWEEIQHQAAIVAQQLRIPYIFRPCGMLDPWSLNQGKWKKRLYLAWRLRRDLNAAAALHFTASMERDLTAPLKLRPPAIVEPNGIDVAEFDPLPEKGLFRSKYPQLSDRPIVLFLSRVHPKKGLDILIPAFAQGAPDEAVLVLAGPYSDGYRRELERLIRQHDLNDRVVWTGMLRGRERIEAYVDADLFCLPSYQENFGIVVAEALAAGTPVLISDQVNIWQEIVSAGCGGMSAVEIGSLAGEMKAWLQDADRRSRAGIAGRKLAFERFSWNSIAERWLRHYRAIKEERHTS